MFKSPFQEPFQNPFPTEGAAAAEDWWLSGGISAGDCVAAYQPKGAASLAASYVNLNNPGTNDATLGSAPTWDVVNGWVFNGASQYLKTGIFPSFNNTMIIKFSNITSSSFLCGSFSTAADRRLTFRFNVPFSRYFWYWGTGDEIEVIPSTSGVQAIANNSRYFDGLIETPDISSTFASPSDSEIIIGGLNNGGSNLYCAYYAQAFSYYDTTITAAQVLAVTNAMNLL